MLRLFVAVELLLDVVCCCLRVCRLFFFRGTYDDTVAVAKDLNIAQYYYGLLSCFSKMFSKFIVIILAFVDLLRD